MASETRLLFRRIDEPGLASIDTYRRLGGYRPLERALKDLEPEEILEMLEQSGLRGRGGAGFSMGKKASFLPRGEMESSSAATPMSPSRARSRTASSCRRTPTSSSRGW